MSDYTYQLVDEDRPFGREFDDISDAQAHAAAVGSGGKVFRVARRLDGGGAGVVFAAPTINRETINAINAARRGDLVTLGTPTQAIAELNQPS